jgi:hypothetical protein
VNKRLALGTTWKGNLSALCYFSKMKSLGDEMAAAGRPLDGMELIEYIITGLNGLYTPLISAICARAEPISLSQFYSQLLSFETHVGLLQDWKNKSINVAARGGFRGRGGMRGQGTGGRSAPTGRGRGSQGRGGFNIGYNMKHTHTSQKATMARGGREIVECLFLSTNYWGPIYRKTNE